MDTALRFYASYRERGALGVARPHCSLRTVLVLRRSTSSMARPLSKRKLLPEAHGVMPAGASRDVTFGPRAPPPPDAKHSRHGGGGSPSRESWMSSSSSSQPREPWPTPPRKTSKSKAPASNSTVSETATATVSSSASSQAGALPAQAVSRSLEDIAAACSPPAHVDRLSGPELEPPLLRALIDLVRRNMRDYVSCDDSREKRAELVHPDTRIVAVRSGAQLLGFASYRLNVEEEGVCVCYLYELQLEPVARGMRLGSTLVGVVEEHARSAGSLGLMLTVHTRNASARRFYRSETLGFEPSPLSPAECAPPSISASCEYEILQKMWDPAGRATLAKKGAQAKRFNYLAAIERGELTIKVVMKAGHSRTTSPSPVRQQSGEAQQLDDTQRSTKNDAAPPTPPRLPRRRR